MTRGLWEDAAAGPAPGAPTPAARRPAPAVLTVSQLNREAARLLQGGLGRLWVGGELSNVTRAASGHWYFTLKDARACVRAVMFRTAAARVPFTPGEGLQVEVLAGAGLYEARGDFQLTVERMREAGAGDLYRQFVRLKERLQAEGLFDAARKRPLPAVIRRVGVVTSSRGAALRDVVTTLRARSPRLEVVLYPAAVQGERAVPALLAALDAAEARAECDVLLLVRGGGSIEDLRAFNDERLARRVAALSLPVVCGVGHESDFSICDFVADLRAPTPTAAAVAVSRDRRIDIAALARLSERLRAATVGRLHDAAQTTDLLARRLRPPRRQIADHRRAIAALARRLAAAIDRMQQRREAAIRLQQARLVAPDTRAARVRLDNSVLRLARAGRERRATQAARVAHLATALALVDPHAILGRGYALVYAADGRLIRDADSVAARELLRIELARGALEARVEPAAGTGDEAEGGAVSSPRLEGDPRPGASAGPQGGRD